ncbi:hypothetical protein ABFU65_11025 [Xanthomonas campestris pv. raphani]|nr:hypothetical protein [Xanthomonas euvesicatoria]MBV6786115.1 hypothetical protein [Xanthomonas campestris pv. uppalii]
MPKLNKYLFFRYQARDSEGILGTTWAPGHDRAGAEEFLKRKQFGDLKPLGKPAWLTPIPTGDGSFSVQIGADPRESILIEEGSPEYEVLRSRGVRQVASAEKSLAEERQETEGDY